MNVQNDNYAILQILVSIFIVLFFLYTTFTKKYLEKVLFCF